ncbi:MAG: glycosyltransferase [Kiritimatiellae bacterium]|nr:glycosyltransferase [Kiritimatiellia bacterium]
MKRIREHLSRLFRRLPEPKAAAPTFSDFTPVAPAILVVDYRWPTPDQDSGSVRMTGMLEALIRLGFHVTFVADDAGAPETYRQILEAKGIRTIAGRENALAHLKKNRGAYQAVIASKPHVGVRYLMAFQVFIPDVPLIYDTVDLHWMRRLRQSDAEQNPALRILAHHDFRMESLLIPHADAVLAITEDERHIILERWPGTRVHLLHNIHEINALPRPFSERDGLMFIGGFEHTPNGDAMRWFASDVLPLIAETLPDIRLTIVGSNPTPEIQALQSQQVRVAGFVPQVEPCFNDARLFIAPLRAGAGMKGKIGQAMGYGLPVVTTTIGAEGMSLEHERTALIADTPEAFAAQVVRLHADETLWSRLREKALEHIETHFSTQQAEAALAEVLEATGGKTT